MAKERQVSRDTSEEEEQLTRAQQMHDIRVAIEQDALKKVLDTWEGRRVLFNILGKGDIYGLQGSMPYESEKCQRVIGRMEVAQELLQEMLQVNPQVYILMQQEADRLEEQLELSEGEDDA